ncbi:MAG: DUF1800 domain-containing protein [Phycisphaerales bacterium]|nr:DUF1800 domain-containing protein [Phycisphaerales bacterium]
MPETTLRALNRQDFDFWAAHHLLSRAGFGGTPDQVLSLSRLGLDDAVDFIVDYQSLPEPEVSAGFQSDIMRPPTREESMAYQQARRSGDEEALSEFRRRRQERQAADRKQVEEMRKWWLERMIETPRPLEEKMTLFWHGHFATGYRAIEDSWHMYMQNRMFRTEATGNFGRLLYGIIRDPAMLRYLNNNQNRKQRPNENLSRELMELFSLGEGNEYTESDIKEGARALTGYTYEDDEFRYNERNHDQDQKTILGRTGNFDGDDLVGIILSRRVCSEFIAMKLYKFFVNDEPSVPNKEQRTFITAMGRRLRTHEYDLKPLLKALFKSEHFYAPENRCSVVKSPIQLMVQTIRSLRTPVRDLSTLSAAGDLMGQSILEPPSVKGWDGGRSWINTSTLFVRQNLAVYLLTGKRPDIYDWQVSGVRYDGDHMLSTLERDERGRVSPQEALPYLCRFLLGSEPHPSRLETLNAFLDRHGGRIDGDRLVGALCLITSMPEYQLC